MSAATARSARTWIGLSVVVFLVAATVLPFVGPTRLDLANVWARQEPDWSILTRLRTSRTLLGLVAGGALALAGSLFQSMLRDALATHRSRRRAYRASRPVRRSAPCWRLRSTGT